LAPSNVLAGGRIRIYDEVERGRRVWEYERLRRTVTGSDWERTRDGRKLYKALEGVANIKASQSPFVYIGMLAGCWQNVPHVFRLVGGRKVEQRDVNIKALNVALSEEQFIFIERILPFEQ
ncbi:hypothetical protein K466DRAFT_496598, partial [Polyporus arcularius HHB13444]